MMKNWLNNQDEKQLSKYSGDIVWACDYCFFVYQESSEDSSPYLQIIGKGQMEELICEVGRGVEFGDYDTGTAEEAIESGLDVLHLYDVPVRYADKTDEDLGCAYGEYGSNSHWLSDGIVLNKM